MREITHIVVHYTATPPQWFAGRSIEDKKAEIDRWHREGNGWSGGFGYHFLIDTDGQIIEGRPVHVQGAHSPPMNRVSVAICYVGDDRPTSEQFKTLFDTILRVQAEHGVPHANIIGHKDVQNTKCPGNLDVQGWWRMRLKYAGTVT